MKTIEAKEGDSILDLAHEYDIDLEGESVRPLFLKPRIWFIVFAWRLLCSPSGACEGSVACSTCHVILEPDKYDLLPEPEDEENDMLDMAFGLTDTYVPSPNRHYPMKSQVRNDRTDSLSCSQI